VTAGPLPGWMMVTVTASCCAWVRVRRSERRMVAAKRREDDEIIYMLSIFQLLWLQR